MNTEGWETPAVKQSVKLHELTRETLSAVEHVRGLVASFTKRVQDGDMPGAGEMERLLMLVVEMHVLIASLEESAEEMVDIVSDDG